MNSLQIILSASAYINFPIFVCFLFLSSCFFLFAFALFFLSYRCHLNVLSSKLYRAHYCKDPHSKIKEKCCVYEGFKFGLFVLFFIYVLVPDKFIVMALQDLHFPFFFAQIVQMLQYIKRCPLRSNNKLKTSSR